MGRSGKVNPAFLYRNELDPKNHTITQESNGQELPGDQEMEKFMKISLRMSFAWSHLNNHLYVGYNLTVMFTRCCMFIYSAIYSISYIVLSKMESCLGPDAFLSLLNMNGST